MGDAMKKKKTDNILTSRGIDRVPPERRGDGQPAVEVIVIPQLGAIWDSYKKEMAYANRATRRKMERGK